MSSLFVRVTIKSSLLHALVTGGRGHSSDRVFLLIGSHHVSVHVVIQDIHVVIQIYICIFRLHSSNYTYVYLGYIVLIIHMFRLHNYN